MALLFLVLASSSEAFNYLKYNTDSQTVMVGPFLDDTDGKTAETGLTIANTDVKLAKHNSATFTSKASGGCTHVANGYYYCTFNSTDSNTYGRLLITVNMSGALPVFAEYSVVSADMWAMLMGDAGLATISEVASGTWGYSGTRGITANSDKGDYSLAADQSAVTIGTVTAVANAVDITQTGADKVWDSTTRTVTAVTNAVDITQGGADKVWDSTTRTLTSSGSSGSEDLREGNVRKTFVLATAENATRKVGVGKIDYIKIETKADAAADWSAPTSTKYLYFWYAKTGDVNPVKVGENN